MRQIDVGIPRTKLLFSWISYQHKWCTPFGKAGGGNMAKIHYIFLSKGSFRCRAFWTSIWKKRNIDQTCSTFSEQSDINLTQWEQICNNWWNMGTHTWVQWAVCWMVIASWKAFKNKTVDRQGFIQYILGFTFNYFHQTSRTWWNNQ